MRLSVLNNATAMLHGMQALVALGLVSWLETEPRQNLLFNGGQFKLIKVAPVWHKDRIEGELIDSGRINVCYIVVAFFALSTIFQGIIAGQLLPDHARLVRFAEYGVSASIMMMAIALEAGVRDVYTLECVFALTCATQIFGALAEMHMGQKSKTWLVPHAAGWLTFLCAYGPVLDILLQSGSPPDPIFWLVVVQFGLFCCFGAVQAYGGLVADDARCDAAYIILSFVSKTSLGWMIIGPILADAVAMT